MIEFKYDDYGVLLVIKDGRVIGEIQTIGDIVTKKEEMEK